MVDKLIKKPATPKSRLQRTKPSPHLSNDTQALREKMMKDLEEAYRFALEAGNYASALRAKELQGKVMGLFQERRPAPAKAINEMTDEELMCLLESE